MKNDKQGVILSHYKSLGSFPIILGQREVMLVMNLPQEAVCYAYWFLKKILYLSSVTGDSLVCLLVPSGILYSSFLVMNS